MREAVEDVRHILTCCSAVQWSGYKERHDRVVYQAVRQLCKHYELSVPTKQDWGATGMAVPMIIEGSKVKITVDYNGGH